MVKVQQMEELVVTEEFVLMGYHKESLLLKET